MDRKQFFTTFLTATATGALISACKKDKNAGEEPDPTDPPGPGEYILWTIDLTTQLLAVNDIALDAIRGIYVKRIAASNEVASFTCYNLECTHSGCIVILQGSGEFHCPCHGSK